MLTIDSLPDQVNHDPALVRRGRYVNAVVLLDFGDASHLVHIRDGRVEKVEAKPVVMPVWTFAIRAPREEWDALFMARPRPGSHDIMALLRRRVMTVEGDLHPFVTNLQYFKDLLSSLRDKEGAQ
ncbi:hypothetical protein HQO84_23135 [Rhodococcus fascians]|nr:hypothetical protein [Rhodococcus fascians]MBY3998457.1 hypothetical protein [Rhodococcus fascians]MBY4004548.1 hypothetical protein [Rhodococcus fascians]MBY4009270.1 hypothetical protein [Rhodococcus fascians]MBY4019755.1 hypothetical protein [Rhodococcus fascians]